MLSNTARSFARLAATPYTRSTLRRYATETSDSNLLSVSLFVPHAPVFTNKHVNLITVPGAGGYMGIARNHLPIIAELKPGLITVDEPGKPQEKYFVSGGFAYVHQDKTCEITAVEAFPIDQLDQDAVRKGLTQFNTEYNNATDPETKAKAQIGQEVYRAMAYALGIPA